MKYVGKNIPKIDGMSIATGKPSYTEDLASHNALVVKLLRSPHAFARIKSIQIDKAVALPGVVCVLTHKDVPQVRFSKAGQTYPEPSPYDRLILDSLVRYVGDEVAIVAAVDERTALRALDAIQVDYEVYEPVLDYESAMTSSTVIHPEEDVLCHFDIGMDREKNIASTQRVEIGNVDEEIKKCPVVVEVVCKNQAQCHAMMETYRAYTYMDHQNRLVVVTSTQIPFHVRRQLARALAIPVSRIRVIKPRIGGGFGGKQTGVAEVYVAMVTLKTGRPAKLIYDRGETFSCSNSRHAMRLTVRLGAELDGHIQVVDIQGLSDTGAYGEHCSTTFSVAGEKTLPLYNKAKALRFAGHVVYTNKMPAGAFRGYGATQGTFAMETAINKLAEALEIDPGALRKKNLIQKGEKAAIYLEEPLGSSAINRCIDRGKELFGWTEKYPNRDVGNGKVRGVGMAVTMQGSGIAHIDTASAEVRLGDEGNFTLLVGSTDMGTGSDTILLQMAAEVLETDMNMMTIHAADTDISPYDPGSYASSTTYVTGMAVVKAAELLKKKMITKGAELLGETVEKVSYDGERRILHSDSKELTFEALAQGVVVGVEHEQLVANASHGSPVSPPPFVAGFAEVEVDRETGKVTLIDYLAVVDAGKLINPNLARVQAEGGLVQGIGMALFEDVRHDSKGKMTTDSFMQYKIPSRKDIGRLRVFFEESHEPTGPFGAKSIGEVVTNTPAPAIVEAVYQAVGVRITNLPITPEKLYKAMKG